MSATTGEPTKRISHVLLASAVGSALEWYDFFIYGTASALVFGELFFPKYDAVRRHAGRLCHLRRRLHRAAVRRPVLRPFRRPHGAQADAGHHAAAGRRRHLRDRPAADLRVDRHLGADPAAADAPGPGLRRRRRIWRRGDLRGRIRAARQARPLRQLRAHGRRGRQPAGGRRVLPGQRLPNDAIAGLGLAHPVPGFASCCWASACLSAPR